MKKKYQKPVQLNLRDLAPAKGSCCTGISVEIGNISESNHTTCTVGTTYGNETCGPFGVSASACDAFGATAGI